MYPTRFPYLYFIQTVGIVAAVIATIALLGNPLALLALFYLPTPPVMQNPADLADVIGQEGGDDEGDYQGTGAGFTGSVER